MEKRAFLVLGPESSGNRLLTRCLIAAGCDGDGGHGQRFDRGGVLQSAGQTIVWRRSLPHAYQWPDLLSMLRELHANGYTDVRVIAIIRTYYCTVQSQIHGRDPHVGTEEEAESNIAEAIRRIALFAADNHLPIRYLTYESLIHNFSAVQKALQSWGLHLETPPETIRDENSKHLSE